MAQAIQRQLEEIEVKHKELENQGVTLEKALRGEDSSTGSLYSPNILLCIASTILLEFEWACFYKIL